MELCDLTMTKPQLKRVGYSALNSQDSSEDWFKLFYKDSPIIKLCIITCMYVSLWVLRMKKFIILYFLG